MQRKRYLMDLDGKWTRSSLLCMAGALFTLAVYYFGLLGLSAIGIFEAVFCLFLPLLLMLCYIILIHFLRWNAPGLYAIIGFLFCLFLFLGTFISNNILRIILGVINYPLSALILISCAGGRITKKQPAVFIFPIAIFFRLIVFGLGSSGIMGLMSELPASLLLASMACLMMSMEEKGAKQ